MTVDDILRRKGTAVITVSPEASIRDAINTLVGHGVGALLVVGENEEPVGMLTERDILRANARQYDALGDTRVRDLMSRDVIIGFSDDDVEYVSDLMTERRIRHLPIMAGGRLAGLISIGDVVKARAKQAEIEVRHLTDYITGRYPS